MTISSTTNRNDYVGTGAVASYSYNFRILSSSDLLVTQEDTSGNVTTLALTTHYTVTGVGSYSGGVVTLVSGNLPSGYKLSIRRRLSLLQQTDFRNRGGFFPEDHETAFDRATMIALQHQDEIDRSIKLPETEPGTMTLPTLTNRASKFLAFDPSGNPIGSPGPSNIPVSSPMTPVVQAASIADSLVELGISQVSLVNKKGANIASASTLNLDAATGDLIDITGSVTVTAITLAEGIEKTTRTTGAPLFTNGASLILPGNANIQAAAGDIFVWRGYASGVVRCVNYERANGLPPAVDVQIFTSSGTWTKPSGAKAVKVICIAAGGGGGGGRGGSAGTVREGGTGGGGGAKAEGTFDAADLGSSETITVGAAGTAGTGGSSADGTDGGGGGNSSFGSKLTAFGGGGGGLGSSATNRSGGSGGGTGSAGATGGTSSTRGGGPGPGTGGGFNVSGGEGAANSPGNNGSNAEYGGGSGGGVNAGGGIGLNGGRSMFGGGGGGGGCTISTGNSENAGGAGGDAGTYDHNNGGGGGAAGATNGGAGGAGANGTALIMGEGGGGGGSQDSGTGGAGGAGGAPGGGGGGGGGGTTTGGNGGAGGRGEVRVYTFLNLI